MVKPYANNEQSKKEQVARMFDNIAPKYDFLNHFLSLGIDVYWRKKAVRLLKQKFQGRSPEQLLDVATGTGDLALELLQLNPQHVHGVDIAPKMLELGREKVKDKSLEDKVTLQEGDAAQLAFEDNQFEGVTVAFGVRNFDQLEQGLAEMYRVLKPGGMLVIIEFSRPKMWPFKQIFNLYFRYILPRIGRMISGDKQAYSYLPASVLAFPEGHEFLKILQKTGFKTTHHYSLTLGICAIYTGTKPSNS
jgi:demethylmenaquinone methyltransferase/2-methoxy-6-polyprenyl-1,4-benzoquinol methylase